MIELVTDLTITLSSKSIMKLQKFYKGFIKKDNLFD